MTTKTQDRLKKNPHWDAAHLPALDMGIRDIPLSRAFANVKPDPARRCLTEVVHLGIENWPKSAVGLSRLTGLPRAVSAEIMTGETQRERMLASLIFFESLFEQAGVHHPDAEKARRLVVRTLPDPVLRRLAKTAMDKKIGKLFPDLAAAAAPVLACQRLQAQQPRAGADMATAA